MSRAYNFCAGPAALPEAVLQRAREEMLDYRGTGMSVMEMSHRDSVIVDMAEKRSATCATCSACPTTTRCCSCRAAPAPSSPWCR